MFAPLPRADQRAPANRAERRQLRRQARRDRAGHLLHFRPADHFDRDGEGRIVETPTETIIARAVADAERQIGHALPEEARAVLRNGFATQLENIERVEAGQIPVAAALSFTPEQEAEAARLLAELLPKAREIAASLHRAGRADELRPTHVVAPAGTFAGDFTPADASLSAALAANGFTLADLRGVFVYEAPPGAKPGWHADVAMARAMTPFPDIFGTRVDAPCATREEALRAAMTQLLPFVLFAEGGA